MQWTVQEFARVTSSSRSVLQTHASASCHRLCVRKIITVGGKRFRSTEVLFRGKIAPSCTRSRAHRFLLRDIRMLRQVSRLKALSRGNTSSGKLTLVQCSVVDNKRVCPFLGFAAYEYQSGYTAAGLVSSKPPSEARLHDHWSLCVRSFFTSVIEQAVVAENTSFPEYHRVQ